MRPNVQAQTRLWRRGTATEASAGATRLQAVNELCGDFLGGRTIIRLTGGGQPILAGIG